MKGLKNRVQELRMVAPSELAEHPKNWRRHTGEQRDAMTAVLEEVGIAGAVLAYESEQTGRLTIIDGHMRKELIDDEVPVLVLDLDDVEAEEVLATFDRIGAMAGSDDFALNELIDRLKESGRGTDQLWRAMRMEEDERKDLDVFEQDVGEPEYPIIPNFDEAYHYVLVFARTEREWQSVISRLELPRVKAKGQVAESRVILGEDFVKKWDARA